MRVRVMRRALMVFAKKPVPGRVKTRLTPPLSPEEAAELYRRMLLDTLAKTGQITGIHRLLFHECGEGARDYFVSVDPGATIIAQEGADLGERLANAFRTAFDRGYGEVAVIGTDAPHVPRPWIEGAYDALADAAVDVVFGPSGDGGYYLLGMKRLHESLFTAIPWSTGEVLACSRQRAAAAGLRTVLLQLWHDVDTAEDLRRPELVDPANGAPLTREFMVRQPLHSPVAPGGR